MSGDYSRIVFDPSHDYDGVLLQQGRPLLDSDWNDQVAQGKRQVQATRLDTFGGIAVVPIVTPDGFKIALSGSQFTIGRGRMYVDGLLAENHCLPTPTWSTPVTWDEKLSELYGAQPVPYNQQPWLPNPPALPTSAGPHLVYLDVWQREVTAFEAPDLVDKAVGVDSTTRLQTVWQVKVLANGQGTALECGSEVPGWNALVAPSAGRLSNGTATYGTVNPCLVPPTGGYTGLENQLYRVEIHEGGAPGTATFKWSRDNASVQTRVSSFVNATTLVVESVGKDDVLRFNDGDWIELLDDWVELNELPIAGKAGELHRIVLGGGVDDATRTITLETPVTPGRFNADPAANRHTRIRRWDQKGQVLRTDTASPTVYMDLDAGSGTGAITVPANGTVTLALESGIVVAFDLAVANGVFKSGDWWVFAARASDASIEPLKQAPPRGIHHHYARLGFYVPGAQPTDCRQFWPPAFGGDSCCCTVCVSPQEHAQGAPSLQQAIDTVIAIGGGTVCLEIGDYELRTPLKIEGASTLRLVGQGQDTRLHANGPAIGIAKSTDVTLEDFAVSCSVENVKDGAACIVSEDNSDLRLRGLSIAVKGGNSTFAAMSVSAGLRRTSVRDCLVSAPVGLTSASSRGKSSAVQLEDLRVEDNVLQCSTAAIELQLAPESRPPLRLLRNHIAQCNRAGIELVGGSGSDAGLEIAGNRLEVNGSGMALALPGVRVVDNDVVRKGDAPSRDTVGIALLPHRGKDKEPQPGNAHVLGNRVSGFSGAGIFVQTELNLLQVKQNQVERCGAGIDVAGGGRAELQASIENNQLADIDIAERSKGSATRLVGIAVAGARSAGLVGNSIARFGATVASPNLIASALLVEKCDGARVTGNELSEIGPSKAFAGAVVGVLAMAPLIDVLVEGNRIRRDNAAADADASNWLGILLMGAPTDVKGVAKTVGTKALDLHRAVAGTAIKAASATAPAAHANVRGNQVWARGGGFAVSIVGVLGCNFSHNQCMRIAGATLAAPGPDVLLYAQSVAADGNRVDGATRSGTSIQLVVGEGGYAVLGNLTSGAIRVGNAMLPDPWAPLNRLLP